jgi:ABC-2 type transport system permease protein/lipopolysaccharide transport system permease protein
VFWLILPALVYIWGIGAFFSGVSPSGTMGFVSYVGVGWLVFRMVQTVVMESTNILSGSSSFILDGHVRLTDFVLLVSAKAGLYFVLSVPVAVPALLLTPAVTPAGVLWGLLAMPIVVANALWCGLVLALMGARYRDLGQLVSNLFMFGFLLTPVIWHASLMPANTVRGEIMRANPLYHLVEFVRAPVIGEPLGHSTLVYVAVMTVLGWLVATAAYRRYARFVPIWV